MQATAPCAANAATPYSILRPAPTAPGPDRRYSPGMKVIRGHNALRRGRFSQSGRVYHVTFATAHRKPWFADPDVAVAACRTLEPSIVAAEAKWICWVLMPDHFHGLFALCGTQSLSRCVQRLKGRATQACREAGGGDRVLWARGFYDHAMRREEDVLGAARYIIANPQRAGLVSDIMQYPYWNANWL